jgi:two-component system OmpR family sensor kinase
MPIRIRLALILALATALAFTVGGWLFVGALSDNLRQSLLAELHARAGAVSQQLQSGTPGVGTTAPTGTPDLSDSQDVTQVLDENGRVLASSGLASNTPLLSPADVRRARHGPVVIEATPPGSTADSLIVAEQASDGRPFLVVVSGSLGGVHSAVSRATLEVLLAGIGAVLAAGVAGWLIAGAALAPVERMRRGAAAISALDQNATLDVPGTRDEIAALAQTLNDLLLRLQSTLDRQRSFVASAGHELRSPLTILKMELELAGRPGRSKDDLVGAIREAAVETDRLIHLAEDLLLLAESDDGVDFVHLERVDLTELGARVVAASTARALACGVALTLNAPLCVTAEADPIRVRQALDNLLDNALRFAPSGSSVTLSIHQNGDVAELSVLDEGPGVAPEFIPRAFDRFSRPDGSRENWQGSTGLGLSIVQSIAQAHSGEARITNRVDGGTSVVFRIPVEQPESG